MTTTTKTYTDNTSSSAKSTWVFKTTWQNALSVGSSSTFTIPATSVEITRTQTAYGAGHAQHYIYYGSFTHYHEVLLTSWPSGSTKTASSSSTTRNVSSYFNSNNPADRTYSISVTAGYQASSLVNTSTWETSNSVEAWGVSLGSLVLTLNAPPTVEHDDPTYATPHYTGRGAYTISGIDAEAYYGGTIASIKLAIGADSVVQNYSSAIVTEQTLSLTPSQAGTFTPTITVTDSRGQITTETLSSIIVEEVPPPTFTTSNVITDTYYYINNGITTASITISNIDSLYDTPTQASFGIGSQFVNGNLNGEDHITLSINIDQPALSSRSVWVRVYDSNYRYRQEDKDSVHIYEYDYPSANVRDIYRVNDSTKEPDDEGTYAVLKLMLSRDKDSTYIKFTQPTILIDGNTPQNTILWYSDENLTQQITWPYLEPASGTIYNPYYTGTCIIYGVLSEFEVDKTYSISITPNDNYYSGNTITTTLPQAFFTLDVLAGGHGIAFGRSAKKECFDIYMPTSINGGIAFNNGVFIDVNQNEALYTLLDSNKLLSKLQVPNVEIVMSDNWSVGSDQSVVFTITYNNYLHDFEYQPNDFNIIFEELERPNDISIRDMWIDNSVGDNIWLIQKHIYETNGYYNDGVISFKVIYKYKGMTLFEETYSKQLILH